MRTILKLTIGLSVPGLAAAHALEGEVSLAERLFHQLAGAHHLPMLLLIAALVAAIWLRLPSGSDSPP